MRPFVQFLPLLLAACATHAFTPSARPMPLTPVEIPKPHEQDVQLDGTVNGEPLGPGITAGNLRYRRGVAEHIAITGDTGVIHVDNENTTLNPYAGTARVGVQAQGDATDEITAAAFGGIGGGYAPEAGGWVSTDVGFGLAGDNRYLRPVLHLDAYVSQPVASEVFAVGDTMLRLPRTWGLQGLFGFDIGARGSAVMVGLSIAQLWASHNDKQDALSETFLGLGAGFRLGSI